MQYRFWYIKGISVLRNGEIIYERKITDVTINGIKRNGKEQGHEECYRHAQG